MTLAQLALTIVVLGGLGLIASRFGLSAIPAYVLAGLLLGPNEPTATTLIQPSEVTDFVAEVGIVFLLFFLGLEFTLDRLLRSGRHLGRGGAIDLVFNLGLGFLIGVVAFGFSIAALVLAAAIYVSSSAITVKGLIDFRRLADDETDLVLAILVFEDLVIAFVLGFVGGAGGELGETLSVVGKALAFITVSLAASRWLRRPIDRLLDWLPREFFLLAAFAFVIGMAAVAEWLGLSEAIGALMAGIVLAETAARAELEDRFFSFRDIFAALFFFVFGLSVDVEAFGDVGWLLAAAVLATLVGKIASGYLGGLAGGFTRRQGFNAGVALVAHGEFTVIIAELASDNPAIPAADRADLVAFAGLYVLVTATIGVALMKESKALGRRLFAVPRLERGG
jgi:CPA2 family monovalent cation:H+ antiporter-2